MFTKKPSIEHEYMQYSSDDVMGEQKERKEGFLSTIIRLLTIFLLLGTLFLGSVFGYRYLQKDNKQVMKSDIQHTPEKSIVTKSTIVKVQHQQKMYTQEEMEAIVTTMMEKLEKDKKELAAQETKIAQKEDENPEVLLLASLASIEADHINEISKNIDSEDINTELEVIQSNNSQPVDTHNQVTIYRSNYKNNVDEISQKIGQIVTDMKKTNRAHNTYARSLTKEVSTRKDAMRILIVRKGDTLSKIAQRAYGSAMAYQKIYDANPDLINNPNKIYVGQKLRIPQIK